MKPSRERAERQWSLMKRTARVLGMRGDTTREIHGFPGIVARHASKADHAAYLRLMTDPSVDLITAPEALAALARRRPRFAREFANAEARRFDKHDRPALDAFRKTLADIVEKAECLRDSHLRMDAIHRLRALAARIPEDMGGFGPRWHKEGQSALAAAIHHVETAMSRDSLQQKTEDMGAALAEIRDATISEKKRASARAVKSGKKGGRPRNNPDVPQFELMRAIDRRVKAGLPLKVAVAEVLEFYKASGRPLRGSPQTVHRQYCAYRKGRSA